MIVLTTIITTLLGVIGFFLVVIGAVIVIDRFDNFFTNLNKIGDIIISLIYEFPTITIIAGIACFVLAFWFM